MLYEHAHALAGMFEAPSAYEATGRAIDAAIAAGDVALAWMARIDRSRVAHVDGPARLFRPTSFGRS